jgi:glycosyltransferase involved in cell wall biosynthesis
MIKIFFVISTLEGGGAERVMLNILKHINPDKFRPVLVLFERRGELLAELPPEIQVEILKRKRSRYGLQWLIFLRLATLLRKEKPDAIVSFMWYPNLISLLAKLLSRSRCRAVVSERYSLSFSCEGRFTEFLRRFAVRFFYPVADAVIVNSAAMAREFTQMFRFPEDNIVLIHNPMDIGRSNSLSREEVSHSWYQDKVPIVIAVGRLTRQKGYPYLLRAMKIVLSRGMDCRLVILGKGAEEEELRKLAAELKIDDRVALLGFQENPYKYLARSTLFVLSSLYEGFPNALLDAISLGVPSIATRCPTGPEEIVTDGVDGILVPPADEKALADAIQRVLLDKELRNKLSGAGKKRAESFMVEEIVKQYENVIEAVCAASAVR